MADNDLRELWDVELSLLEKFKDICKKYDLTYYAGWGTLLGAARHKGFIPWDDDMDLALPWPDYKKLTEVAPKECSYPFFFQGIYTEPDAMAYACRLRRSDTTGFTKWEYENVRPGYDLGVFIDIFPLFYIPDLEEEKALQKEKIMHIWNCLHGRYAYAQEKRGGAVNQRYAAHLQDYKDICEKRGHSIDDDAAWLKEEYLDACVWNKRTKLVGPTSSDCHKPNQMWNAEWFDRTAELPFENTTVCCPAEYEKILETTYGDWRTPVMGGALHEMAVVDTRTPWLDLDFSTITTEI